MSVFPVIAASNYDASIKFYTEKLGFDVDMSMAMPDGNMFGILTLNGKGTMVGFSDDKTKYERAKGIVLMLYPDDFEIDDYYKQVTDRGVKVEVELKTEGWGDRTFSLLDPDGVYLTFTKTVEVVSVEEAEKRLKEEAAAKQ